MVEFEIGFEKICFNPVLLMKMEESAPEDSNQQETIVHFPVWGLQIY